MHYAIVLTCLLFFPLCAGCLSSAPRFSSSDGTDGESGGDEGFSGVAAPAVDSTVLMRVVSDYLGAPYQHGGRTVEGMDCSAFTQSVFEKAFSISLPRSTDQQFKVGKRVRRDKIAVGDLVFFNTNGRSPSHVGVYIGDGMFAHASVTEGVTLSSMTSDYYSRRYCGSRRILH